MPLTLGCNHVTVATKDINKLINFYTSIFDAEVTLDLTEGPLRHVFIEFGAGFYLHPFEIKGGMDHDTGLPTMFKRGHVDHFALSMPDRAAFEAAGRRLIKARACEGRVRDFGLIEIMAFTDPDGMECEIALMKDGAPLSMADSKTYQLEIGAVT